GAARRFYLIDNAPPRAGQCFRAPGQAEVLRRICREGAAGFYRGEVAEDLIESLRALAGVHSMDDMAAVSAELVTPISADYRGTQLVELSPNGQGITALMMAKILARLDLGILEPLGAQRAHLEDEAAKLAYDARNRFVADPRQAPNASEVLAHLLSDQTARALADLIDPGRAMPDPRPLNESAHRDTVYLTVVAKDRCAVSLIFSVFHGFGTGRASERFGLLFQNRGAGFSLTPGHPNEAAGGKRPLHTIIPAMLRRDGRLIIPFGVMGGPYQPTGHIRILTNLVDNGMDLQAALGAPRSFAWTDGLELESGYEPETVDQLSDIGHRVQRSAAPLGGSPAIWIDQEAGVLIGASDPRKDGCALGY
ncbi:MAG: gamma-glutamyltransferase, partial [Thiohalocapsa sp.]